MANLNDLNFPVAFEHNGTYLYADESGDYSGIDFTFYDLDYEDLDGGQIDNPDMSVEDAILEICEFMADSNIDEIAEMCNTDIEIWEEVDTEWLNEQL